jgi:hypothetical protein
MQDLAGAARRGRLVVVCSELLEARPALPAALWVTPDRRLLPWASEVRTAAEVEEGRVRRLETGTVLEVPDEAAWGTPRRPTRLGEWFEQLQQEGAVCRLEPADLAAEFPPGARALPLPPLTGVASRAGVWAVVMAAVAAAGSWLALWVRLGGGVNWRWTQLAPWGLVVAAAAAALAPLAARAAAGVDLPAREWYARVVARWSRWPRSPLLAALLLAAALGAWWLALRYARGTFLILYEPGIVSVEGRPPLGACRAEEPCTVIVPRGSHLHFEGADGGLCGLDFTASGATLFIDTQQEGCEPYVSEEEAPPPRG